jgi:hypothetical protein
VTPEAQRDTVRPFAYLARQHEDEDERTARTVVAYHEPRQHPAHPFACDGTGDWCEDGCGWEHPCEC